MTLGTLHHRGIYTIDVNRQGHSVHKIDSVCVRSLVEYGVELECPDHNAPVPYRISEGHRSREKLFVLCVDAWKRLWAVRRV